MKRYIVVGLVAAGVTTALALLGFAYVNAAGTAPDPRVTTTHQQTAPAALPQPDTSSPDWKLLSDDLGIWITRSDRLGLQGRLYVRRGDAWWPVAVDGAADIRGFIPVR